MTKVQRTTTPRTSSMETTSSSPSTAAFTPSTSAAGSVANGAASDAAARDIPVESVEEAPIQQPPAFIFGSSGPASMHTSAASSSANDNSSSHGFEFRTPSPVAGLRGGSNASEIVNSMGGAFAGLRLSTPSSTFTLDGEELGTNSSTPRMQSTDSQSNNSALNMHSLSSALRLVGGQTPTRGGGTPRSTNNSSGRFLSPESQQQGTSTQSTPRRSRRRSTTPGSQERHEVRGEERPQSRYHQPVFQQALADSKGLVNELVEVLSSSGLHNEPDSTMKKRFKEAKDLSRFDSPASRTVGFVGDSGVGKSSLINSLLDIRGLARTSNSGAACTCVVTEYRYHESQDFVVEVEWFSREDIETQIEQLLDVYRLYHSDHLTADEREALEEESAVAHDTFKAMFRDHLNDEVMEVLLLEDEAEDVVAQLMEWVEERNISSENQLETLPNANVCARRLMELTSEPISSQEPSIWPFIRKIVLHVNAHILSKGLVLVDLPGLRDLNSARRNITERHLFEVDEIFAVCLIGRATTDMGVQAVFNLAKQAHLSNVGIICTKSDDIRAEEAEKDWTGSRQLSLRDLMDTVEAQKTEVSRLKSEIDEFSADEFLDDDDETRDELLALHQEYRRAQAQLATREFQLKRFLVTTRNDIVTNELRGAYNKHIRGNQLTVFCVSNIDYWAAREARRDVATPLLQLSGILDVRRHCIGIVAEAQYRAASLYMSHEIPALLQSLKLWVESGSGSLTAERKESIRKALDLVEQNLKELEPPDWELPENPTKTLFQSHLVQNYEFPEWVRSASYASSDWSGWHPSSYSAFCRNYGDHTTGAVGYRNWNNELMEEMVRGMRGPWDALRLGIRSWEHEIESATVGKFDRGIHILRNKLGAEVREVSTLVGALKHRQRILVAELEAMFAVTENTLSKLENDVFSDYRTSFIGMGMEASYRACNMESGTGSDARRKGIIRRRVGDTELFQGVARALKEQCYRVADVFDAQLEDKIAEHMAVIMENMAILKDENVALESERDPAFRNRVDQEVIRVEDMLRTIQARIPN